MNQVNEEATNLAPSQSPQTLAKLDALYKGLCSKIDDVEQALSEFASATPTSNACAVNIGNAFAARTVVPLKEFRFYTAQRLARVLIQAGEKSFGEPTAPLEIAEEPFLKLFDLDGDYPERASIGVWHPSMLWRTLEKEFGNGRGLAIAKSRKTMKDDKRRQADADTIALGFRLVHKEEVQYQGALVKLRAPVCTASAIGGGYRLETSSKEKIVSLLSAFTRFAKGEELHELMKGSLKASRYFDDQGKIHSGEKIPIGNGCWLVTFQSSYDFLLPKQVSEALQLFLGKYSTRFSPQ